jgi:hypothetical protein
VKTLAREPCRIEIVRRLRTVRPDSVRRWGRMSAHQMICHLSDAFLMMTGEKAVSSASVRMPRVLVKWIALYLPLRWPEGILTRPEIDQQCGGTRPVEFAADVVRVETLLDVVTMPKARFEAEHPVFGRMSHKAWLRWGYMHMDHHLRQFGA